MLSEKVFAMKRNNMRKLLVELTVICFFTGFFAHAHAKLSLGTGEWAPYTGEEIVGKGFVTEIVVHAFQAVQVDSEVYFFPFVRCEQMLKNKHLDAIFPYAITMERKDVYFFSEPIIMVNMKFFFLKEKIREVVFTSCEKLKKYRIGGVRGYFYEKIFQNAGLDVEYVENDRLNIQKILAGRIDLAPIADINGWYLIKKHFPDQYNKFATADYELPGNGNARNKHPICLMVLKQNPQSKDILNRFNRGLKIIRQNKVYDKILRKYGITE